MLVLRGRRINLLLTRERSRRLLFRMDLRDRVVATRVKAKVNHPWVRDTLDGIAHRGKDLEIRGHHSPNHQWDMHKHGLFLLTISPMGHMG